MALSEDLKAKLNSNIQAMIDDGHSDDEIESMVNEFNSKYDPTMIQAMAPNTTSFIKEATTPPAPNPGESKEDYIKRLDEWKSLSGKDLGKSILNVASDVYGTTARGLGAVVGKVLPGLTNEGEEKTIKQALADPNTSVLRPLNDYSRKDIQSGMKEWKSGDKTSGVIDLAKGLGWGLVGSLDSPGNIGTLKKVITVGAENIIPKGLQHAAEIPGLSKIGKGVDVVTNATKDWAELQADISTIINSKMATKKFPEVAKELAQKYNKSEDKILETLNSMRNVKNKVRNPGLKFIDKMGGDANKAGSDLNKLNAGAYDVMATMARNPTFQPYVGKSGLRFLQNLTSSDSTSQE